MPQKKINPSDKESSMARRIKNSENRGTNYFNEYIKAKKEIFELFLETKTTDPKLKEILYNKIKKVITKSHQGKKLFGIESYWGVEEFAYNSKTYHFHIWLVFKDDMSATRLKRLNKFLRHCWRRLLEAEKLINQEYPSEYSNGLAYIKRTRNKAGAVRYSAKCVSFKTGKPWHISKRWKEKGSFDFHYNLPKAVKEANHQKGLLSQRKRARGLIESFIFPSSVSDKVREFRKLLKKQALLFS
jgi:hypothetical protein